MTAAQGVGSGLLGLVMLLVVWQPRGLPVAVPALGGAIGAFALGLVRLPDLVSVVSLTWNATLTLVGLLLLSATLEANGAFRAAAHRIARAAAGDGRRLFVGLAVLTLAAATLLANDGAILILTPIVAELATALAFTRAQSIAYLFAVGFLCDALSTLLPTSNLTNILMVDGLHLNAARFAGRMALPTLVLFVTATAMLEVDLHRSLPRRYDVAALGPPPPFSARSSRATLLALALLSFGYALASWVRLPLGVVVALVGGGLLAFEAWGGGVDAKALLRKQPWSIVIFAVSLFVLVYGLAHAGAARFLAELLDPGHRNMWSALAMAAGAVALLSAAINNLPVFLVCLLTLSHLATQEQMPGSLPYAALLGANVGSKLTPVGSLCTLLWLHLLDARGLHVGWGRYLKLALLPTLTALAASLAALAVTGYLLD